MARAIDKKGVYRIKQKALKSIIKFSGPCQNSLEIGRKVQNGAFSFNCRKTGGTQETCIKCRIQHFKYRLNYITLSRSQSAPP